MEQLMWINQQYTAVANIIESEWLGIIVVLLIPFVFKKIRGWTASVFKQVFLVKPFESREALLAHQKSENRQEVRYYSSEENPVLFGVIPPPEDITCQTRYIKPRHVKSRSPKHKNAKLFFNNILCEFSYTMYSESINNGDQEPNNSISGKDAPAIINNLLKAVLKEKKAQIIHIHGEIGSGKSTLMGAIITELDKLNNIKPTTTQYLPIVIDVRETMHDALVSIVNHENPSEKKINRILEKALVEACKDYLCDKLDSKYTGGIRNSYDLADIVDDLVDDKKVSPILFIDELDTIYSLFCKNTFCEVNNLNKERFVYLYRDVIKYFVSFQTDGISNARLNKCAFFIAYRTSTEKFFEEIYKRTTNLSSKGLFGDITHSIKLDNYDNIKTNKIIVSRAHLKYIHVRDKRRQISESDDILNYLSNYENADEAKTYNYEKNLNISIHGLRHIMNLLGKAESIDPTCFLLSSFITNPGLLRIFQYLDGVPDFSSSREGMSNIFLINRDYVLGKYANDTTIKTGRCELIADHLYTFTLKYLIFGYIVKTSKLNNRIYLEDILKTFCYRENGAERTYEEHLVRLALFNSTEVEHGRLMKMGWDDEKIDHFITPSTRCVAMFEENMFWEFGYLMVMVEDAWIEFPQNVMELIIVDHKDNIDAYKFITNYHISSINEKMKFIKNKAMMVLKFCYILEIAFKYEKQRYQDAFDVFYEDIECPNDHLDISSKIEKVENSIIEFTKSYVSSQKENAIKQEIKDIENEYRDKLHKKMKEFYRSYHQTYSLVPMKLKMKKYHKLNLLKKYQTCV